MMKSVVYSVAILLSLMSPLLGEAEGFNLKDFEKLPVAEQWKVMQSVPEGLRLNLEPMYKQSLLEAKYGGRAAFAYHQRLRVIAAKGLQDMTKLAHLATDIWVRYVSRLNEITGELEKGSSADHAKALEALKSAVEREEVLRANYHNVYLSDLVRVKSGPQAKALVERAKDILEENSELMEQMNFFTDYSLAEKYRRIFDTFEQEARSVFVDLEKLPKLSESEVQEEIARLPQEEPSR